MADSATLLEPASPAPAASPATPAATPTPSAQPAAASATPTPASAPDPAATPAGDDWRSTIAKEIGGDDEKAVAKTMKTLERFNSPGQVTKSWMEATAALSANDRVKIPGKDATPEDVAAFSKAIGVPDKVEKYDIKGMVKNALPDGMTLSKADNEFIKGAVAELHKAGGPAATPAAVEQMIRLYTAASENAQAGLIAAAETAKAATEKQLKAEWGSEFKSNIGFANAGISAVFGANSPEALKELLQKPFADGTKFGDHPEVMKAFALVGRKFADDPVFLSASQLTGDRTSLTERKNAIMKTRHENPKEYARLSAPGGELDTLNSKLANLQSQAA